MRLHETKEDQAACFSDRFYYQNRDGRGGWEGQVQERSLLSAKLKLCLQGIFKKYFCDLDCDGSILIDLESKVYERKFPLQKLERDVKSRLKPGQTEWEDDAYLVRLTAKTDDASRAEARSQHDIMTNVDHEESTHMPKVDQGRSQDIGPSDPSAEATTPSPRGGLGHEGEEAGWFSGLAVPRESFDVTSHFTQSTKMIREAKRLFQEELTALPGRTLSHEQLKEAVGLVNRQCENLFSVLRGPGGQVVTLRFDEASGQAEVVPLHPSETIIRCASLPVFEVVPIGGLPDRDRAILFGRREGHFLSRLRAESMSEEERQQTARQGAEALNRQMAPEQRRERGSKGAKKLNENSTAEERSERARRAVQARWARKRGETDQ